MSRSWFVSTWIVCASSLSLVFGSSCVTFRSRILKRRAERSAAWTFRRWLVWYCGNGKIFLHVVIVARWRHVSSLYASRIDKFVRRAHHVAMSSDKTPDDATVDSVTNAELITRVHAFMCALLTFLGFTALPNETTFDMLGTLTQWLADAKAVRDDRQGITSRLWWKAFKSAWLAPKSSSMLAHSTKEAGKAADAAIAEFGQRFVPIVTEEDRDTLNTADFDAMRAELDQADRYRSEICNALDGVEGNRAFVHGKVIDELRAERDALLKANAHHANEVEQLRRNGSEYLSLVCQALGVDRGADTVATITAMRNERGRIIVENATLANALDGVRAAILAPSLPDGMVAGAIGTIVVERGTLHNSICRAVDMRPDAQFNRVTAIEALRNERDELKAQLAGAIVPLPKPERMEAGQRWAIAFDEVDSDGDPWLGIRYLSASDVMARGTYLGTEV